MRTPINHVQVYVVRYTNPTRYPRSVVCTFVIYIQKQVGYTIDLFACVFLKHKGAVCAKNGATPLRMYTVHLVYVRGYVVVLYVHVTGGAGSSSTPIKPY